MSVDLTVSGSRPDDVGRTVYEAEHESDLNHKGEILDRLLGALAEAGVFEGVQSRVHARLCADEALVNAMRHGNERAPEKSVYVKGMVDPDERRWGVRVEDEGAGFDPGELPDAVGPEGREKEDGRGVLIMKRIMDELTYYDHGRGLLMVASF